MGGREPYSTYNYTGVKISRSSYPYRIEILTPEQLIEKENEKEIYFKIPEFPPYINIETGRDGSFIIKSGDGSLFIETSYINGKGPKNHFIYLDKEFYIFGEFNGKTFASLPWTSVELFILKVCIKHELSAEIIGEILLRSAKQIIKKANDLGLDINWYQGSNPRSEGIKKYYAKMKEMDEKGYKFQRSRFSYHPKRYFKTVSLRGTERIPYKDLGYFYKGDYNNSENFISD